MAERQKICRAAQACDGYSSERYPMRPLGPGQLIANQK